MNCITIGLPLPGKLILSKRNGLLEVLFSWKYLSENRFLYNCFRAPSAQSSVAAQSTQIGHHRIAPSSSTTTALSMSHGRSQHTVMTQLSEENSTGMNERQDYEIMSWYVKEGIVSIYTHYVLCGTPYKGQPVTAYGFLALLGPKTWHKSALFYELVWIYIHYIQ